MTDELSEVEKLLQKIRKNAEAEEKYPSVGTRRWNAETGRWTWDE